MLPPHKRVFAPAKVLLLLRDRVANNWVDLCREFHLHPESDITKKAILLGVLEDLRTVGLIRFEGDNFPIKGSIEVSSNWQRIQTALGVSLVELAQLGPRDGMVVKPCFGPPSESSKNADVLVLMPFAEELRPVYSDHIAKVVRSLKLSIARADDFFSSHSVVSDIWNGICNARLI